MSDKSAIEWTDATWNPVTGCTEVSPGCDNCYAKTFAERWRGIPGHHFEQGFDVVLRPERFDQPLRWTKPRRVFVNSMSDLFHDAIPDAFIAEVFAVMALAPQHTFQLLTKRHGRMRSLLNRDDFYGMVLSAAGRRDPRAVGAPQLGEAGMAWPVPNVWLGVSVENQTWAQTRIHALLTTTAAVRWLSLEPLLGPVDLEQASGHLVDWVVVGGESGRGARPMHPDWVRSLRDQCVENEVPFFFKQWGVWSPKRPVGGARRGRFQYLGPKGETFDERNPPSMDPTWAELYLVDKKAAGRVLDGHTWDEYPDRPRAEQGYGTPVAATEAS